MSEPEKDIKCYKNLLNYNRIMLWLINESVSLGLINSIELPNTKSSSTGYVFDRSSYLKILNSINLTSFQDGDIIITPTLDLLTELIDKVNEYNNKNKSNTITVKNPTNLIKQNSDGMVFFNIEFNSIQNPKTFSRQGLANKVGLSSKRNIPVSYLVGLFLGSNIKSSSGLTMAKFFNDCNDIWEYIFSDLPQRVKENPKIKSVFKDGMSNKITKPETATNLSESTCAASNAANVKARTDTSTSEMFGGKKSHKKRKGKKVRKTRKGKKIKKSKKVHKIKKARKSRK